MKQLLKSDRYHVGDIIECHVLSSQIKASGHLLLSLSRCSPGMLEGLIFNAVPEVEEDKIEICKIARIASVRSKVAVRSKDPNIDPVGAIIGFKGKRISEISRKLGGERIDVVLYNEDPLIFAINAFGGFKILGIEEQENQEILVRVPAASLPMFIGVAGSNVNLASNLVGRKIQIVADN